MAHLLLSNFRRCEAAHRRWPSDASLEVGEGTRRRDPRRFPSDSTAGLLFGTQPRRVAESGCETNALDKPRPRTRDETKNLFQEQNVRYAAT